MTHTPSNVRNVAIAGHGGTGKTTLVERLLFAAGAITRMGSITDKNTVTDYTDEEKAHGHSLQAAVAHLTWHDHDVDLVDTPGLTDFIGHAVSSLPSVESVLIVIDPKKGIEPNTRRIYNIAQERNLPQLFIINKIDESSPDELEMLTERIRETFGSVCLPINIPVAGLTDVVNVFDHDSSDKPTDFSSVKDAHTQIIEQCIEMSDELTAEYFDKGEGALDADKLHDVFEKALRESHLVPICYCSAKTGAGIEDLLHVIADLCPSPPEGNPRPFLRKDADGNESPFFAKPDPSAPVVAHVFKVTADPFVGKLAVFRVHQGTIRSKDELYVDDHRKPVRINHMLRLQGSKHEEIHEAVPGDIVAVSKIDELAFNSVLHSNPDESIRLKPPPVPRPLFGLAVELKNHKDETKFSTAIHKLMAEDPSFHIERIEATKQTVAQGLGEMHLRVVFEKLKHAFGIEVLTSPPKVAYKETISAKGEGHHRHKKQSGGSGEFGEVYLRVEPLPDDHADGFEFVNATVGGSIPRQFMPAIEKGIRQALREGAIAGFPMRGIKVEVYDGKYHAVDSKEVAFVKAGKRAFIDAVQKAKPVLLEPFASLEVTIASSYMGDIASDLSTKRGRVIDTAMNGDETVVLKPVAPLGELRNYANELKASPADQEPTSWTTATTKRTPSHIQQEVVAAYQPHHEED